MTEDELEQKIADLRRLASAQQTSIARRLASDDPVATSDIDGLAKLTVRIDTLERLLEHRRAWRARGVATSSSSRRRDQRGRFTRS